MCVRENGGKNKVRHKAFAVRCMCRTVCARLSTGVQVCVQVALGCVDALQSSGIVPIVEKVRGLIKNV